MFSRHKTLLTCVWFFFILVSTISNNFTPYIRSCSMIILSLLLFLLFYFQTNIWTVFGSAPSCALCDNCLAILSPPARPVPTGFISHCRPVCQTSEPLGVWLVLWSKADSWGYGNRWGGRWKPSFNVSCHWPILNHPWTQEIIRSSEQHGEDEKKGKRMKNEVMPSTFILER